MASDNARKITINNQIVLLRHDVRKARVGVTWKLTKEIKQLKARQHGDKKKVEKCHRKAEKLVEEVHLLGKIKDDEVTKFGIKNFESLQKLLLDQNTNSNIKIMCKLVLHKALKNKIEEFRKTYADYEMYLQSTKTFNAKIMSKIKVEKKTEIEKEIKIISKPKKVGEWLVEDIICTPTNLKNNNNNNNNIKELNDQLISEEENIEDKLNESNEEFNTIVKKKNNDNIKNGDKPNRKRNLPGDSFPRLIKKKPIKIISELAEVKKLSITDNLVEDAEVIKQNFIHDGDNNHRKENEIDQKDMQVNREVDSFFMTGNNNENYMSIAVPKSQFFDEERRLNDNRNKFSHNKKHFEKNTRMENKRNDNLNINEKRSQGNRQEKRKMLSHSSDKTDLHPSWAARKKQQDVMKIQFQGKKIVFGDD